MGDAFTVLVVDDSSTTRKWTSGIFGSLRPDWKVIEAKSGDNALEKIQGKSIDAMLLDLNMPGMDGFELAEKLSVLFPSGHIAILTANIQEATKKRAAERGIQFLPKPVTEEKLRAFIEQATA
jgi:CheY-like chemotaxis protein